MLTINLDAALISLTSPSRSQPTARNAGSLSSRQAQLRRLNRTSRLEQLHARSARRRSSARVSFRVPVALSTPTFGCACPTTVPRALQWTRSLSSPSPVSIQCSATRPARFLPQVRCLIDAAISTPPPLFTHEIVLILPAYNQTCAIFETEHGMCLLPGCTPGQMAQGSQQCWLEALPGSQTVESQGLAAPSSGLSPGTIAGIVTGALALVALIIGGFIFYRKRKSSDANTP